MGRTRKSTLHIKDPAVSEWHAEVRWELGSWMLTDVGSSNGTEVNGARLEEGVRHSFAPFLQVCKLLVIPLIKQRVHACMHGADSKQCRRGYMRCVQGSPLR